MSLAFTAYALHLLCDFPLQTEWMAENKLDDYRPRLFHVCVHLIVSGVVLGGLFGVDGVIVAWIVSFAHFIIDSRRWVDPVEDFEEYPFWVDQTLHVLAIALAVNIVSL